MPLNSDTYKKVLDNMAEYVQPVSPVVTRAMRKQARDSAVRIGISEAEHGQAMIDLQAMLRGTYGV